MSTFDTIAGLVVDTTSAIMGNQATWVKDEDHTYSALVKYKDEKGSSKLGEVQYGVDHWHIEIKDSDFPGLKDAINAQNKPNITVSVRGLNMVFVGLTADAVSDGMCTMISLRLKSS